MYTVSLPSREDDRVAPTWQMSQLAFDSGGEAIAARRPEDLTRIYQGIATDLLHLYRVGYVPAPFANDGSWHRITVSAPAVNVTLRTRSGYYAASGR